MPSIQRGGSTFRRNNPYEITFHDDSSFSQFSSQVLGTARKIFSLTFVSRKYFYCYCGKTMTSPFSSEELYFDFFSRLQNPFFPVCERTSFLMQTPYVKYSCGRQSSFLSQFNLHKKGALTKKYRSSQRSENMLVKTAPNSRSAFEMTASE